MVKSAAATFRTAFWPRPQRCLRVGGLLLCQAQGLHSTNLGIKMVGLTKWLINHHYITNYRFKMVHINQMVIGLYHHYITNYTTIISPINHHGIILWD